MRHTNRRWWSGGREAFRAAQSGADVVLNVDRGDRPAADAFRHAFAAGSTAPWPTRSRSSSAARWSRPPPAPGRSGPRRLRRSAVAHHLQGGRAEVRRLVIPPAGGPFRGRNRDQLREVTPAQALAHPEFTRWDGSSTNSATLVNKGTRVIEAHLLFDIPFERLTSSSHSQRWIHSMVEFPRRVDDRPDGSAADARPHRARPVVARSVHADVDVRANCAADVGIFTRSTTGHFRRVRARPAGRDRGGTFPAVYNAANEVCVDAFTRGAIGFPTSSTRCGRSWRSTGGDDNWSTASRRRRGRAGGWRGGYASTSSPVTR